MTPVSVPEWDAPAPPAPPPPATEIPVVSVDSPQFGALMKLAQYVK